MKTKKKKRLIAVYFVGTARELRKVLGMKSISKTEPTKVSAAAEEEIPVKVRNVSSN